MKKHIDSLPAYIAIFLWFFSGVCFRKGSELLGAMTYLMFITGGGALFAIVIQIARKKKIIDLFFLQPKVIVAGFFGVAVYTILLAYAFSIAEPENLGLINLLNYMWPLWMIILTIILLRRPLVKLFLFTGISSGLIGLVISSGNISILPPSGKIIPFILAVSGGFLWALYSVLLRKWNIPDKNNGTILNFLICSIIAGTIVFIRNEWPGLNAFSAESIFWILFGAIGPVGSAYYFWEIGIKKGSVNNIASLSYLIPVGSSVMIGVFFKEAMNIGLIPGAILISVGALLVKHAEK